MTAAPDEQWRTAILTHDLRRHASSLVGLAKKLKELDGFPTETPRVLCSLIERAAAVLVRNLPQAPASQLPHVSTFLAIIGLHLRYIERSQVVHTPWSMIEATEAFLLKHAGAECCFIIRPQWSYNYHLEADFEEFYSRSMSPFDWIPAGERDAALMIEPARRIYCLSFPRVQRLNALLHANWGHELGHIIAAKWCDENFEGLWKKIQLEVIAEAKAKQEAVKGQNDLFFNLKVSQQIEKAMKITRQAILELISDAVGLHLLGPAALMAASEVAARADLDASPLDADGYPPWRFRLRMMHDLLEKDVAELEADDGEGTNIYRPHCAAMRRIAEVTGTRTDREVLDHDLCTRIPYANIEKEWPGLEQSVLKMLVNAPAPYSLAERRNRIAELVSKLQGGVPPNEYGTWPKTSPAAFADILNAGWVQKQCLLDAGAKMGDYDNLERLVLKAIESSQVERRYGPELDEIE